MADPSDKMMPADPRDLVDALAFALRFQGRKRVHNADEIMAEIGAKRLVEHLERRLHRHEAAGDQRRRSARAGIRAVTWEPSPPQSRFECRGTLYSGSGDSLGASGALRTKCRRSENLVRRQRELSAGFEADSLATIIAKVVLSEFEETLARQIADRDRLRAALREGPPN
jgi:hypothetical protein